MKRFRDRARLAFLSSDKASMCALRSSSCLRKSVTALLTLIKCEIVGTIANLDYLPPGALAETAHRRKPNAAGATKHCAADRKLASDQRDNETGLALHETHAFSQCLKERRGWAQLRCHQSGSHRKHTIHNSLVASDVADFPQLIVPRKSNHDGSLAKRIGLRANMSCGVEAMRFARCFWCAGSSSASPESDSSTRYGHASGASGFVLGRTAVVDRRSG